MLFLLAAALVGDLIVLPAILAGPLGKYFGKERPLSEVPAFAGGVDGSEPTLRLIGDENGEATPEVILPPSVDLEKNLRRLE